MKQKESQSPMPKGNATKATAPLMSFPVAIQAIKGGKKVRRQEWLDKEEYCLLQNNFLQIHRDGKFHNWIVSEGDILAIDWVIV